MARCRVCDKNYKCSLAEETCGKNVNGVYYWGLCLSCIKVLIKLDSKRLNHHETSIEGESVDRKEINKRQLERYHERMKDPEYRKVRQEYDRKRNKGYYRKHNKKFKKAQQNWRKRNKDKINKYHAEWQRNRYAKDPVFRLNMTISRGIRRALNKGYGGKWQDFVDYTLDELRTHLEAQFDDKMNWSNYSKYWVIDHKIPLSRYKKNPIKAWQLSNLQPLEAKENIRKSNK